MRIVKAPLRVSLFGGGTDLPSFYLEYGATIISFAVDLYMYVSWNRRPTGGCRLSYSMVEELSSLTTAKHTLVKATAERYGFEEPCTLTIVSDVPAGTGLGSSSSLSVCLGKLVGAAERSGYNLAQTAFELEQSVSNVGIQDHLPATFGGFNTYRLSSLAISYKAVPMTIQNAVEMHGILLYTGGERQANSLLHHWNKSRAALHDIKALADDTANALDRIDVYELARRLNETWIIKRSINGVATDVLNAQYQAARNAGALGGKLLGAGGCGCWFFLAHPDAQVEDALGLPRLPFRISRDGVKEMTI